MPLDAVQTPDVDDLRRAIARSRPELANRAAKLCEQALKGSQSLWPWRSGTSRRSLRVVAATSNVRDPGYAYDVVSNVPYARWLNRAERASPNSKRPNVNRYAVGRTLQALWPQIVVQLGGQPSLSAPKALTGGASAADQLFDSFDSEPLGFADLFPRTNALLKKESRRIDKNRKARARYARRAREYDALVVAGRYTGGILAPRYADRPGTSPTGRQRIRGRVGGDDLIDAKLIKRRIDRKLHRPLRPARRYLRRHPRLKKSLSRVANLKDAELDALAQPVGIQTRKRAAVVQADRDTLEMTRQAARLARRHINRA